METPKTSAKLDVPFRDRISRWFIFRQYWGFIMIWPLIFWAIWIGIVNFLHFWYMLILGRRHEGLWKRQLRLFRHLTKWNAYFSLLCDERPKFVED